MPEATATDRFRVRTVWDDDERDLWWNLRDDFEAEVRAGRMTEDTVGDAVLA
ncbi:hypothetical protein LCGC14_2281750, partial [marine sediment metagenome]